ncbi:ABC transporter ATP-binding protein [Myxococcota bacterium]|nr:ABC transporter ATP-binding protein [Myxococcota bacterium]
MLIHIEKLTKTYSMGASEVSALRGVSFSVSRGDYVAVMGPSGSGKSTLMHLIGCLDQPSTGKYWLDGTLVEGMSDLALSKLRNEKVGFVFQSFNLIPQLSVVENVEVPLVYRGVGVSKRIELSRQMLDRVGLAKRENHRPTELSGGECQRVAIARALVTEPDILLADEPTGNLDTKTGNDIMEVLDGLNSMGVTILMVTHDVAKARHARRVVMMQDGSISRELVGSDLDLLVDQYDVSAEASM